MFQCERKIKNSYSIFGLLYNFTREIVTIKCICILYLNSLLGASFISGVKLAYQDFDL